MGTANELHTDSKKSTARQQMQADAAQRAQRAWALRVGGASWTQVAELVPFSSAAVACRAVRSYFGRLPKLDRDEQRSLWRDRLELLWRQSMRDVADGKPGAVRAAVALAQRASALDDLDEAKTLARTPAAEEFDRVVSAMLAGSALAGGAPGRLALEEIEGDVLGEDDDASVE